ncbi:holo-[acyl-carrier protein] synthase [Clostridium tetanomorphum]|uniref:Holo-[acyl-carrier-protein] synthase n=1 Tax=Clostridium tetanomorphum TaxID=1553 RepID=A0A923IZZ5_CLOTT|nr:holo-ACP synthase [Clostridium tetanomorphum]KAJ53221.1 4'-phosphopantetheinyl transferase [Clostridium tetanomorphum DSM 665]MBC2397527.1 holo-ACP synthase [Clostridium tetanomorphum]MBP1863623.1 holo-[acyl-carrier protein] synthase [Clostridium tetanomorphum]NRS86199.1 holo-[acyl-carrier protein] synthase [Clostridium tetanomorphum]NRZ95722.1 holo-[acyl-carrier protein] synthase [Clostridium tetanomorphum]
MIFGVGTDIVEIERINNVIRRNPNFLNRIFTDKELEYFKSKNFKGETIAGGFAAKEAIVKAFGTGFRNFSIKDIEVLRDDLGKPVVYVNGKARELLKNYCNYKIHISISHNRENAIAYALMEV